MCAAGCQGSVRAPGDGLGQTVPLLSADELHPVGTPRSPWVQGHSSRTAARPANDSDNRQPVAVPLELVDEVRPWVGGDESSRIRTARGEKPIVIERDHRGIATLRVSGPGRPPSLTRSVRSRRPRGTPSERSRRRTEGMTASHLRATGPNPHVEPCQSTFGAGPADFCGCGPVSAVPPPPGRTAQTKCALAEDRPAWRALGLHRRRRPEAGRGQLRSSRSERSRIRIGLPT